jgi:hypothetical protein
MEEEE